MDPDMELRRIEHILEDVCREHRATHEAVRAGLRDLSERVAELDRHLTHSMDVLLLAGEGNTADIGEFSAQTRTTGPPPSRQTRR